MPAKLERKNWFWNADGQVLVRNPDLINSLIGDKEKAVRQLSAVSPLTLDKITVDETGNVVITDDAYAKKVADSFSIGGGGPTNAATLCGGNITCAEL
jgi:hypothetical protein